MKYTIYFLPVISAIFLALNFIDYNIIEDSAEGLPSEKFDPSLLRLNSLDALEAHVDSIAFNKNIASGSLDYAIEAKEVISKRFYHKYATQDLNENWIASFAQKITGLYLSSKITADDILTKPYGYCGQQNAVLMELLQQKKHDTRVVYLPHHFVIQGNIEGAWQYFDSDFEPNIPKEHRSNESWLKNIDTLAKAYRKDTGWINETFGNPVSFSYGKINEVQGKNAQLFQAITKWLSKIAFLFPLLWFVYLKRKKLSFATFYTKQTARSWNHNFYRNERVGQRTQSH
jgi:hypothetical protein